ncbi:hypothetical protein [Puia sp.]|jgi:hypothetical protein|uniref:hypothetical protein n=1 Tax=Puia sp. TaxID=2045100 RepID=UPI002F426B38
MKKFIGVVILLLTLALCVIYRQLTHRTANETPEHAEASASASMREGMLLSYLLLQ